MPSPWLVRNGATVQPVLFLMSENCVSLPILFLQVSANLKLSEKQEVKKELVRAEEGWPRPHNLFPRQR